MQDDHGLTPLALALITGHQKAAAKLVALGADVNVGDNEGVAPTHRAAGHGDMEALELLVGAGADLETQSGAGTPLHWAAGEVREAFLRREVGGRSEDGCKFMSKVSIEYSTNYSTSMKSGYGTGKTLSLLLLLCWPPTGAHLTRC